jgi:RHS repeat-associated protein
LLSRYDEIGNLTKDNAEGIETIKWDVYGKITDIERASNNNRPNLSFRYDATGNRIMKIVKPRTLEAGVGVLSEPSDWLYTFYFRDAQGNIITTEDWNPSDLITREYNIYGSARVGTLKDILPPLFDDNAEGHSVLTKSRRNYELTNHLGNVMTIVTDLKRRGKAFTDHFEFTTGSWISVAGEAGSTMVTPTIEGGQYVVELNTMASGLTEDIIMMGKMDFPFVTGRQYKLEAFVDLNDLPFGGIFVNDGTTFVEFVPYFTGGVWTVSFEAPSEYIIVGVGAQVNLTSNDKFFVEEFSIYDITDDNELPYYADVKSAQDYYPFGMLIPNRTYNKLPNCEPVVTNQTDVDIIDEEYSGDVGDWQDGQIEFTIANGELVAEVITENSNTAISGRVYETVIGEEYTIQFDVDIAGLNSNNVILLHHSKYDEFGSFVNTAGYPTPLTLSNGSYSIDVIAESELMAVNFIIGGSATTVGSTFILDNFKITGTQQTRTFNCAGDNYLAINYRFGFNGKELDSEGMGGGGSTYDYGFRIYNPQIAKFLSVDPLTASYSMLTPYQFASNSPIAGIDLDGLEFSLSTTPDGHIYINAHLKVVYSTDIVNDDMINLIMHNVKDEFNKLFNRKIGDNQFKGWFTFELVDKNSIKEGEDYYFEFQTSEAMTALYSAETAGIVDQIGGNKADIRLDESFEGVELSDKSTELATSSSLSFSFVVKTAVHELAHLMGLLHTFQDETETNVDGISFKILKSNFTMYENAMYDISNGDWTTDNVAKMQKNLMSAGIGNIFVDDITGEARELTDDQISTIYEFIYEVYFKNQVDDKGAIRKE